MDVLGLPGVRFGVAVKDLKSDVVASAQTAAPATAPAPQDTVATSPAPEAKAAPAAGEAPAPARPAKKWTFLFYINGNNFLSKQAPSLLRQLEFTGSDDNINVVAQVARQKGGLDRITRDWSGVRRYEVPDMGKELNQGQAIGELFRTLFPPYTRGIQSNLKGDLGKADMGSKDTLADFIKWGMKEYPAEHVCVVMLGPSQGMNGIMHDDTTGHSMKPDDLSAALADVQKETGRKVDVLAFDASNATQAEMLDAIKDNVGFVVGSEGLVSGQGMSVPSVVFELKKSNQDKTRTPLEVAQTFTMVGSMAVSSEQFTPTLAAIDMSKVGGIKESVNDLGDALLKAGVDKAHMRKLINETQEVGMPGHTMAYEGVRDAYHFAQLLFRDAEITDPAVKAAAQKVMDSVENALVGEAHRGGHYRDAHGISIFLPDNYGFIRPDQRPFEAGFDHKFGYEKLGFAQGNAWPRFLASVAEDSFAGRAATKLLGESGADNAFALQRGLSPTVASYSGLASTLGWWESYNVLSTGLPKKLFFIPANVAAGIGVYGGAWDAYNGVKNAYLDFRETRSIDGIVMNGLDVVGGAAKAAACASLLVPGGLPLAHAAGTFGFAKPWLKQAYGYVMQYKQIRDSIALSEGASSKAAILAAQRMIGQGEHWDK